MLASLPRRERRWVCEVCGKQFSSASRRRARYCSEACRSKAYRQRKQEARESQEPGTVAKP
jgi:hypothetical protein